MGKAPVKGVFLVLVALVPMFPAVDAKKEKPMNVPFPQDAIDDVRCDVCRLMAKRAYGYVYELFVTSEHTRIPVNEENVLVAIEDICNPLAASGQWIRQVAVDTSSPAAAKEPFHITLTELSHHSKCKRTCKTLSDACEAVVDDDDMDQFSSKLLILKKYKDASALADATCGVSAFCTSRTGFSSKRYKELLTLVASDVVEVIEQKEMDIERFMDEMERKGNRRQEIYSREEVIKMQKSLIEGDIETAAGIDPSLNKLTEEEQLALQQMLKNKPMGKKRPPEDAGQAASPEGDSAEVNPDL
ncbi:hypothetical protein, conserved [Trypanosoma brucei gambiense DAL972]|uniref:T. brucei spp.-specific protein n=1 Tax=Trypanosoma brucei gambiense (strain MHOM/CI/86/DAL972) TaxID=679716 RepID=D0A431_TRYB9|nr:hypothetical protein, conserved [Trypanosoma brucei gambiense DAL972]CBH16025.1 hypothetical protein, conserved [Trypanosoma brucei gambiense DAL972]|eukprot:XP_011778289.1 hypothetical protein, conserved [Trypanosoma brucei gambiense DAL972]